MLISDHFLSQLTTLTQPARVARGGWEATRAWPEAASGMGRRESRSRSRSRSGIDDLEGQDDGGVGPSRIGKETKGLIVADSW